MNSLNLSIDDNQDDTDAKAFVQALDLSIQLLDLIGDSGSPHGATDIRWRIADASKNSPLSATLVGDTSNSKFGGNPAEVFEKLVSGISGLSSSSECPNGFGEAALNSLKLFGRLRPMGVRLLRFSTTGKQADISSAVIRNANSAIQKIQLKRARVFEDTGSIEGDLLTLSGKGNALQFTIVDSLTKQNIPCYFSRELDRKVRDNWNFRVCVVGKIRTNGVGEVTSVQVEDIIRLGNPSLDWESSPVNITNGMESSEYIRGIRDDSYG